MASGVAPERRVSVQRAFLAGATGYTGRHVLHACLAHGVATVAHVRPDSARRAWWRGEFTRAGAEVDETPWEAAALRATLLRRRPSHLFILIGTTRARGREATRRGAAAETYETVDYALPHLLIAAAREAAAADASVRPRLIYLSAVGAREDTRNSYLRVRGRLERELRESGLPWLAVRPSFITGPDRDEARPLERATATAVNLLLAPLALLGGQRVRDRYRSITGAVLGEGLVRLALAERGSGRVVGAEEMRG